METVQSTQQAKEYKINIDNIYVLEEQYLYAESVFELLSEDNGTTGGDENPINWEDPEVIAIIEQLESILHKNLS